MLISIIYQAHAALNKQGFTEKGVHVEQMLNMHFDGTNTSEMLTQSGKGTEEEDFGDTFKKMYDPFGFLLAGKGIIVDDIKVQTPLRMTDIVA